MNSKKLKNQIQRKIIDIDATDVVLGRLAAKIACILQGKHKATYETHIDGGDFVHVSNIDRVKITGKTDQKKYYRYSGYPSGLKTVTQQKLLAIHGAGDILKRAVKNMLPKNKLQNNRMKRLIIN